MNSAIPADAPKPRHCHVKKWLDFNGYGFNLHAEKNKLGHHIGALDEGSPAEAAGLREGDRIIEVNGTNIANENHQQVVSRIRAVDNEVKLLVVDTEADDYYRERSLVVRGDMAGVTAISTPPTQAAYIADPRAGYTDTDAVPTGDATPAVRLAKLRTWQDFKGYGFNLTSEKAKPCQFIGKVDAASPAATANVFEGDRIVEVNGVNVTDESHHQVVARIKVRSGFVDLLLVDKMSDVFFSSRGTVICGDMPDVVVSETPEHTNGMVVDESAINVSTVNNAIVNGNGNANGNGAVNGHGNQYAPRLCYLALSPEYKGYGFDLQSERGQPGHKICSIEDGSLASRTALRPGDHIVEVNDENVERLPHDEVLAQIKKAGSTMKLLVIDEQAALYFLNNNIPVREHLVQNKENGEVSVDVTDHVAAAAGGSTTTLPPLSRLCHLQTAATSDGFGFELHRLQNQVGHFIGPIDHESPAALAGLHSGDEIIDIQGTNVQRLSHSDIVQILRQNPQRVTLLVTNPDALRSTKANLNENAVELMGSTLRARHCFLKKWSDFDGYGFDLYEIRKNPGPRVGNVAHGSPANATQMRQDDYIIEVNGENVEKLQHMQVVKRVSRDHTQVRLLLVDPETQASFKSRSVRVHSAMDNVDTVFCPDNQSVVSVSTAPRHIQLTTQPGSDGFGFELHMLSGKEGHHIGAVDADSPAAAAGLEVGDQLVEVNGKNVLKEPHAEVVNLVRAAPGQLQLLVVSASASTVFHSNALWVNTGNRDTVIMVPRGDDEGRTVGAVNTGNTTVISENAPRPRLCKIQRWADFSGYGFDLYEERNRPGHLIGSVEMDSPANVAGLKQSDQIVEVNGHNVLEATHHEVVEHIKQHEDNVQLLVVDSDAKVYYEDNSIWVHSKMHNVHIIECPRRSSEAAHIPIPLVSAESHDQDDADSDTPAMRLCVLRKWPDYTGYGFNLHDEKGSAGHFIAQVDRDSPAEAAGLRIHDKVIEVNRELVNEDHHHQVVQRVMSDSSGVSLLVADADAVEYFHTHNLMPHGNMSNIAIITCPASSGGAAESNGTAEVKVEEVDVQEQNGHAPMLEVSEEPRPHSPPSPDLDRAPTPEPVPVAYVEVVRESQPEPVMRAPSPEPVHEPSSVLLAREPSPEPVREPSPEPVRQPSPIPIREPASVREVNGEVDTVVMTTEIPETKPDPESNMVQPEQENAVTLQDIADLAAVGLVHDNLSVTSGTTSEVSSSAEACYDFEETTITARTSEVAQDIDASNGIHLASKGAALTVFTESTTEVIYENVEPVVDQGTFRTVINVSAEPTTPPPELELEQDPETQSETKPEPELVAELVAELEAEPEAEAEPELVPEQEDVPEGVSRHEYNEVSTISIENTEVVMPSSRSSTDYGRIDDVTETEVPAFLSAEFSDAASSSKRSSVSTVSDSVTHYVFTHDPEEPTPLAFGAAVTTDVTQIHLIESHSEGHINEGHATGSDVTAGSDVTESYITKGVAVNEFMSPAEPRAAWTGSTETSYSYSTLTVDETDHPVSKHGDPMSGSLQDVLNRVKSRKKPQARTGNLSMQEKFALFQEL